MKIDSFEEWIDFCDYYSDRGFIELLGLFRYEDVHNNYLNNVLDENNPYGYGKLPMKYFLKLINSKNGNLFSELDNENDIIDLDVKLRKKLIKSGIPDLFITFKYNNKKYLILMEAKLGSDEHDDQCMNYYNEVSSFSDFYKKIFLYLTLDGRNPKSCNNNEYYSITYQELIDFVYDPLTKEKYNNISLTVEEYLKGFNSLYFNGLVSDYKDIPITNSGRDLTIKLFNRIKNSKIMESYSYDDTKNFINNNIYNIKIFLNNVSKINNLKNEVDNVLINFPKLEDLKTKYYIDDKNYPSSRYVYEVFNKLVNEGIIDMEDEEFNYINLAPDGYKYLYSFEDFNKLNHYRDCYSNDYYGKIIINEREYYYAIYSLSEEEGKELISKINNTYFRDNNINIFKISYDY